MPQGTIKEFDLRTRTGVLLQDDRTEVRIVPQSIEGSGLRYLRIGQRVRFEVAPSEGDPAGPPVARTLRHITFD